MTPPQYWIARGSFTLAALIMLPKVAYWLLMMDSSVATRRLVGAVLFALIGVGWVETMRWIDGLERTAVGVVLSGKKSPEPSPPVAVTETEKPKSPPPTTPNRDGKGDKMSDRPKQTFKQHNEPGAIGVQGNDATINIIPTPPPRRLTDAMRSTLETSLVAHSGSYVMVATFSPDKETRDFAQDLVDVFQHAKWTVGIRQATLFSGRLPTGVYLGINTDATKDDPRLGWIASAFSDVGINIGDAVVDSALFGPSDRIFLVVGGR